MLRSITLALLFFGLLFGNAEARTRHHHYGSRIAAHDTNTLQAASPWDPTSGPSLAQLFQPTHAARIREAISHRNVVMLAHPSGCPRRAFCGCGAAQAVFGTPRRDLWLASNWLRFPRTSPAPGMAAARPGHVFVLRQQVAGDVWVVEDYNSGGGASRLHERSISGYTIVNPHA